MVVLDRERVGAASVGAPWGGPPQWDALRDGGAAAEVRDVEHVDAAGEDDLEDRLTEQLAGRLDRNGAHAGDLAQLVALDPTPHQRLDVDAQQREEARIRAGRLLAPRLTRGSYRAFLDGVGLDASTVRSGWSRASGSTVGVGSTDCAGSDVGNAVPAWPDRPRARRASSTSAWKA